MRIALATCDDFPNLDPDNHVLVKLLKDRDLKAIPAIWDDPKVDWESFDHVIIRSTWDYTLKPQAFLKWISGLKSVFNPAPILKWNTNKAYLKDLAASKIPTVPTVFLKPGQDLLPQVGSFVVKPSIGAGSKDAKRYESHELDGAREHMNRLHQSGKTVMVQPYIKSVENEGETALIFLGGTFSHAIRKGAMLSKPTIDAGLYYTENISPALANRSQLQLAELTLKAIPHSSGRLLYARVDLLSTNTGYVVLELELVEPSLFLEFGPGSAEKFSDLINVFCRV